MKFKTVRAGEQALVFNHLGEGELVIGPRRIFLFRKYLEKLPRYCASPEEYLKVTSTSGLITHVPGPCEIFRNSLEHDSVKVLPATHIDANHLIVVYKRCHDNTVQRRIIDGPAVFIPQAEEWLHEFEWHGEDPREPGHMLVAGKRFTQLPIVPDQFYYNVREVRTADDTTLTVKLMVFYKFIDIITLLEATQDPIADLINAVCADVIAFAGKLSYEEFLNQTGNLGNLKTYPQLMQRAVRIGCDIGKVVYRGYHASDQLQAMHDNTIQARTQMRLDTETAEQEQKITELKLQKEQARTKTRQSMENRSTEHKHSLATLQQKHNLDQSQREHQVIMEVSAMETEAKLECEKARNAQKLTHLQQLHDLGLDLTRFLVAQQPASIDQQVRITRAATSHTTI